MLGKVSEGWEIGRDAGLSQRRAQPAMGLVLAQHVGDAAPCDLVVMEEYELLGV